MTISTHIRIGNFLYKKIIAKTTGYNFKDKISFQYGNIFPDLDYDLSNIKHKKETSMIPLLFHEKRALDISLTPQERLHSLGIVCHYLTDFFCRYHSVVKFKKKSIIKHILYEIAIDFILLGLMIAPKKLYKKLHLPDLNNSFFYKTSKESERFKYGENFDVTDLFCTLQKQYSKRKPGILNDIYFALRATSLTVMVISKDYAFAYPINFKKAATDFSI